MAFVFLSYAHTDKTNSDQIRQDLIDNEIKVWRDNEEIRKDNGWDVEIEHILDSKQLSHFLFLETTNSCRDESVCRDEVERAVTNRIPILRLLFEKTASVPLRLQRKTYIDFRTDYEAAFNNLIEELGKLASITLPQGHLPPPVADKNPTPLQIIAAQDDKQYVRLVAPPGTGKSFVIEERVRWLLAKGIHPKEIIVISFTRASSNELRDRIVRYCKAHQEERAELVHVSTIHSLALTILMKKGLLKGYHVSPKVLDEWEMKNIFDVEMGIEINCTPSRCEDIRNAVEAYWCTGNWIVPPHMEPDKPVTAEETDAFIKSLFPITQCYACLLPGEIVKKVTEQIETGLLQPATVLNAKHLIVDEFQDLNYTDTQFVDSFAKYVRLFVAGDDDQSIYAFRFAYPIGIQQFTQRYAGASSHELKECFRCTPEILAVASSLLARFQDPNRISKQAASIYPQTMPGVQGVSHRWIFKSEVQEADATAQSCKQLISRGVEPRDILILLSNRRIQLASSKKGKPPILEEAFQRYGVPIELSRVKPYIDSESGRFAYALVRIACDADLEDYVAHRTLLGLLEKVGPKTCNNIRRSVLQNNFNYLDIFYNPFPPTMFSKRENEAIARLKVLLDEIKQWSSTDTLIQRNQRIADILTIHCGEEKSQEWVSYVSELPLTMTLEEVRFYLAANQDDERITLLTKVYQRLALPIPETGFFPAKVRVMTMHGVKGLEAQVVFIPGLENDILPNEKEHKYLGLQLEAARRLYVSITRSKAAVILSYAQSRVINGQREFNRTPSLFNVALGGKFVDNDKNGLDNTQTIEIAEVVTTLKSQH